MVTVVELDLKQPDGVLRRTSRTSMDCAPVVCVLVGKVCLDELGPVVTGSECMTTRNKHDGLDDDKNPRITLTTDRLASGRYNSGPDPVLYSGVMLFIQDFNNEGYIHIERSVEPVRPPELV